MMPIDWTIIAFGLAGVVAVNWYFFAERPAASAIAGGSRQTGATGTGGAGSPPTDGQQATIVVQGGYSPAAVRTKAGQPVRLIFDRRETSGCSEEVVFPDFGIRRFLPANQQTNIDVTPPKPGVYEFTCGMGMLRGKLIAE